MTQRSYVLPDSSRARTGTRGSWLPALTKQFLDDFSVKYNLKRVYLINSKLNKFKSFKTFIEILYCTRCDTRWLKHNILPSILSNLSLEDFYPYRYIYRRRQWNHTPVLLPGKSHGRRSLVGCSPWGLQELDMAE